tara:strand:- start:4953 stop:5360 length:408 start_codon:yes stop_codon:yes gene_type:complete
MALKIRLARGGAKKRPFYRVVIADTRSPRDGRFIEKIGTFNPLLPKENTDRVVLDVERAKHWLSVGALPTDRVSRFLDDAGIFKRAVRNNPKKSKPKAKAQERLEAERVAAEDAAEAAKTAAEAPAEDAAEEAQA